MESILNLICIPSSRVLSRTFISFPEFPDIPSKSRKKGAEFKFKNPTKNIPGGDYTKAKSVSFSLLSLVALNFFVMHFYVFHVQIRINFVYAFIHRCRKWTHCLNGLLEQYATMAALPFSFTTFNQMLICI